MVYIEEVKGREILESRGLPTVEVEILLSNGMSVSASAPSGTSYGIEDFVELRDKDMGRYHGYGVLRAVEKVNNVIAPRLYKKDPQEQFDLDELLVELDGTPNRANLGINTMIACSMAVAKAGAVSKKIALFEHLHDLYERRHNDIFAKEKEKKMEDRDYIVPVRKMAMPEPIFNIINGRESENSKLDFQDVMIMFKGVEDFETKIRYASEVDHNVQKILAGSDYFYVALSNEGGFSPNISSDKKAIELMIEAVDKMDRISPLVYYGVDVAATGLYDHAKKVYKLKGGKKECNSEEMVNYLLKLSNLFPIIFFEDGLASDDYDGWKLMMQKAVSNIGIVGDDLFNGNLSKVQENKKKQWANAISIKPNQVGTLMNTLDLVIFSQQQGLKIVFSHRSGETNDDFLSDLAVGMGADYIKAGSVRKGERVAKYNRLLKIKEKLEIIDKTNF